MGQTQTPQEVREIPLSLLEQDPMNIRDAPKIDDEFRDSISKGVIEPLVVRPVSCVEDKKAREKLISNGKQFVVTAEKASRAARVFFRSHESGNYARVDTESRQPARLCLRMSGF
jgi:hypothetical protein